MMSSSAVTYYPTDPVFLDPGPQAAGEASKNGSPHHSLQTWNSWPHNLVSQSYFDTRELALGFKGLNNWVLLFGKVREGESGLRDGGTKEIRDKERRF